MTNVNGSKWIRPEKRLAVYLRDGFTCLICNKDLHAGPHSELTLDHINPRLVDQGDNEERNIYLSCLSCNSKRQSKPLSMVASPEAIKNIWQHVSRNLEPYKALAETLSSVPQHERETPSPGMSKAPSSGSTKPMTPAPPPPAAPAVPQAPAPQVAIPSQTARAPSRYAP